MAILNDKPPGWDDAPPKTTAPPGWDEAKSVSLSSGKGRGDELFQPDPSPSEPIKKDVRPLIDLEGNTKILQDEIRAGKPGEPVGKAQARAAMDRVDVDPIANDPIAQELILGQATGGPIAKGLEYVGGKIISSAPGRVAGRFIDDTARGASKKIREAIGQVKDKASDFVTKNPEVMRAKNPQELREALKNIESSKSGERKEIFAKHDAKSEVVERPVLKPLKSEPKGETAVSKSPIEDDGISEFDRINTNGASTEEATKVERQPNLTPREPARNRHQRASATKEPLGEPRELAPHEGGPVTREPFGDLQRAGSVEEREMIKGRPAGILVKDLDDGFRALESKFANGTNSEKDIAAAIKREREKFMSGRKPDGAISAEEARKHASDFQKAFDKSGSGEGNAANQARKEMSKVTLDSLYSHVGEDADKVRALTSDLSVAKRLGNAAKEKIKIEDTPGKRIPNDSRSLYQRGKDAIGGAVSSVVGPVDKALAKLANANLQDKVDVHPLVEQALASGATQAQIDSVLSDSKRIKEKKK